MVRIFTPKIKRLLWHSVQQFIVAIVVFALAIALTFVEDFCRASHRPLWLIIWIESLTVWLAIVDGVALISISGLLLFQSVQEFVKKTMGA